MPDRCSIPECGAISNRINGKISIFRFPRDANLKAKWLKSIGKKDWEPPEKAVICEKHFEPSCITKNNSKPDKNGRKKPKIMAGSLPTILVPPGTPLGVQEIVRRVRRRGKKKIIVEGKRKKGRRRKNAELDSMPLQQRLTAIATTSAAPEPEKPIPTLKSQPLSPTKLKVTRQSSKPQSQPNLKPVEEQVHTPVREEVCLKWNTHHSNMQTAFPALLNKEQYCDVTLLAEGMSLKCHKLILSSCSAYFDQVLEKVAPYQHPIIFMKDIPFNIIKALCDFMYVGEVNILNTDLDQILAVGKSLKIKGLESKSEINNTTKSVDTNETPKFPVKPSKVTQKPPVPEKKDPANDVDITDPLDLMEPTYEEAATPDVPPPVLKRNDQTRKSTGKRIRKRKHVEVDHEPSPPVFRMRKGTRSRPNVKVPRYFNANFDNSVPTPTTDPSEFIVANEESVNDPFLNILDQIKTEPLDIEDNPVSFEEETFTDEMANRELETEECYPAPRVEEPQKVLKRRRVSRSRYSAVAKQEKPDPLNFDHNTAIQRQEDELQMETGERIESQEENNDERLDMQVENSDRDEIPIENSDREELPIEDVGKEDSIEGDIERDELHLQNSDFSVLENFSAGEIQIENRELEERLAEDSNREDIIHLESCEQGRLAEDIDRNEMVLENSEKEGENDHFTEIQMNHTYTEQACLANGEEELPAAFNDGNEKSIENSDKEESIIAVGDASVVSLENSDKGESLVAVGDRTETSIENNEKEESITAVGDETEASIENSDKGESLVAVSDRTQASIENRDKEESLAAVGDGTEASIENSDREETSVGNTDTPVIQNENIHRDRTEGDNCVTQELANEDAMQEKDNSDGAKKHGENSGVEDRSLEESVAEDNSENFFTDEKTSKHNDSLGLLENKGDEGNREKTFNSVQEEATDCNSEESKSVIKENPSDEVSTYATGSEPSNSNDPSKME